MNGSAKPRLLASVVAFWAGLSYCHADVRARGADMPPPVVIDFFYQEDCADCERVQQMVLPGLEERYQGFYVLNRHDANSASNTALLAAYQEALRIEKHESVLMVVDYRYVFSGPAAIEKGLLPCVDERVAERLAPGWKPPEPISVPRAGGTAVSSNLSLSVTNVPVVASLASDLVVVPQEVALVVATGKVEPVTRFLAVRSKKGLPFKVLGVDVPAPGIKAKVDSLPSGGYRVQLTGILPSPDLDGKRFLIRTDRADARDIPVPIRVTPRP